MFILINLGLEDEEILEYIRESRMLSKTVDKYDNQKSVALTSAKRMAEFLGEDILKGSGLNCNFIISKKPVESALNQRAIPIAIFNVDEKIRIKFLKKWLKESNEDELSLRRMIDWDYYIERLGNTILKIVSIPAAIQKVNY